jgi:cytochrome c biogenesis protein CcdA
MLRLIGLVISIGLADSVNPTTVGPALYLASGKRGRHRVAVFTLAVFAVSLLGGAAIALGPGRLVLSAFPPGRKATHILEVVVGTTMLGLAGFLWWRRDRLSQRELPRAEAGGRSSAVLGATITAIELPTAFPYFAAITAIVSSGRDAARQLTLLVLFNVCFVLPLLWIILLLAVAGDRATTMLTRAREQLQSHWPAVLAGLALLAGVFVVLLGITGLAAHRGRPIGMQASQTAPAAKCRNPRPADTWAASHRACKAIDSRVLLRSPGMLRTAELGSLWHMARRGLA